MSKIYPESGLLLNEPFRATCISAWELRPDWANLVDHFILTAHYDLKSQEYHRHAYGVLPDLSLLHFTCAFKDNVEDTNIEGLVIKPFMGKFCQMPEEDVDEYVWGWPKSIYWKKNKWIKKKQQGWRALQYATIQEIPPREEFFKGAL